MKHVRHLAPYVGGLVIAIFLLWLIDWRDVFALLIRTDLTWLLIGCGWYILTNILRAFRFRVLLGKENIQQIVHILPEMFALSFLNNVLPSRTGELSFPYFMQRRHKVAISEATTALLIARIFDLLSVITLYIFFALIELRNLSEDAVPVIGAVGLAGALIIVGLLVAPWLAHAGERFMLLLLDTLRLSDKSVGKLLIKIAHEVANALFRMRRVSIYARTYTWSIAIWLAAFAWFDAFLRAIDVPVRYTLVVIGATFASLAKALPFISIGGFGAHEAGWTIGFSLVGMERSLAISTGFAVNLLTLAVSVIFGGLCIIAMNIGTGKLTPEQHK